MKVNFEIEGGGLVKDSLQNKADEVITYLKTISGVKKCTLYGSLSTNTYDELSDIDIEIDVSGCDNGQFMLGLVSELKKQFDVYYSDYAPSLIPDKYIVSIAIDKDNPFLIIDLCCCAEPHCTTVTKQQVLEKNEKYTHVLKLWTANVKHYVRGSECYDDILKMVRKITVKDIDTKDQTEMLEKTLCWLEENAEKEFCQFVESCRKRFEELVR